MSLPAGWDIRQLTPEESVRASIAICVETTSAEETLIVLREEVRQLELKDAEKRPDLKQTE
jgi:hypothetical protein